MFLKGSVLRILGFDDDKEKRISKCLPRKRL